MTSPDRTFSPYEDSPLAKLLGGLRLRIEALTANPALKPHELQILQQALDALVKMEVVFPCFSEGKIPTLWEVAPLRKNFLFLLNEGLDRLFSFLSLYDSHAFSRLPEARALGEFFISHHTTYDSLDELLSFLDNTALRQFLDQYQLYSGILPEDYDRFASIVLLEFSKVQNKFISALSRDLIQADISSQHLPDLAEQLDASSQKIRKLLHYQACKIDLCKKCGKTASEDTQQIQRLENDIKDLQETRQNTLYLIRSEIERDATDIRQTDSHLSPMENIALLENKYRELKECLAVLSRMENGEEAIAGITQSLADHIDQCEQQIQNLHTAMLSTYDPRQFNALYQNRLKAREAASQEFEALAAKVEQGAASMEELDDLRTALATAKHQNIRDIPFDTLDEMPFFSLILGTLPKKDQEALQQCRINQPQLLSFLRITRASEEAYLGWWHLLEEAVQNQAATLQTTLHETKMIFDKTASTLETLDIELRDSEILVELFTGAEILLKASASLADRKNTPENNKSFLKDEAPRLLQTLDSLTKTLQQSKDFAQRQPEAVRQMEALLHDRPHIEETLRHLHQAYAEYWIRLNHETHVARRKAAFEKLLQDGLLHERVTHWLNQAEPAPGRVKYRGNTPWDMLQMQIEKEDQRSRERFADENQRIRHQIRHFRLDPAWRALYQSLSDMETHGNRIITEGNRRQDPSRVATGKAFIQFANELKEKVHAHVLSSHQDTEAFKDEFATTLKRQENQVSRHYELWKPILLNLALLLAGIGVVVIPCKMLYGHLTHTSLFFGGYTQRRELVRDTLEKTAQLIHH